MTLKEVNELNRERLTLAELRTIYDKYGYAAIIRAGRIVEFVPESRKGRAAT